MKYKKEFVMTDDTFFEEVNPYQLAKYMGMEFSYLYRIKNGHLVVSEEQYHRLKNARTQYLNKKKEETT